MINVNIAGPQRLGQHDYQLTNHETLDFQLTGNCSVLTSDSIASVLTLYTCRFLLLRCAQRFRRFDLLLRMHLNRLSEHYLHICEHPTTRKRFRIFGAPVDIPSRSYLESIEETKARRAIQD